MDYKAKILFHFPWVQTLRFKFIKFYKINFVFLRRLPFDSKLFGPPRGFYNLMDVYPDKSRISSFVFSEIISQRRTIPFSNSLLIVNNFTSLEYANIIAKVGYVLNNARYYSGYGGFVITNDDKVFIPCSPLRNEWYPNRHHSLYKFKLPKCEYIAKVVIVDSRCANENYGHWMLDLLPRLLWIKKMDLRLDEYVLFINSGNQNFYSESIIALEKAGFNFKSIKPINNFNIISDEIVIPPYCTYDLSFDYWSRDVLEIQFLQKLFQAKLINGYPEKIYISRRKSIRTFEGELELVELLNNYGYKEVFLEENSLEEQVNLFCNANKIIGLHGSGFTNLCFSKKDTMVLEIFSANYLRTDFWSIASINKLKYYAYCEDDFKIDGLLFRAARQMPTNINIEKLQSFIQENNFI